MLSQKQVIRVLDKALSLLDTPYGTDFNCVDFVRLVYRDALDRGLPPLSQNLTRADIETHTVSSYFSAHVVYLRHKKSEKLWSHVAIMFGQGAVIHNSYFFGRKVTITSISDMLSVYNIVQP